MNTWILNICLAFFVSIYLSGVVISNILLIAFRKKLFDIPNERKIHTLQVPRLGGIAFKPVIFFTLALLTGFNIIWGNNEMIELIEKEALPLSYCFCALMLLYLVGISDDLVGIRYYAKFTIQIICGLMFLAGGIYITDFQGFLGIGDLSLWFAYPFTILLVVFITNAINLIDGIDGLASGLCSIALTLYGITFYMLNQYLYAIMSFTTLGVLIPFFYYNVFGDIKKQKKIFMGDTGSLTIGMILCFLSIQLTQCDTSAVSRIPNLLIMAYSPLLIPCFDVIRVYFYRIRHGKNPFLPDKSHIHHKLLAFGLSQREAMILILSMSVLITMCNILLSPYMNLTVLLSFDALLWTGFNLWLTKKIKYIKERSACSIL